MPPAPWVEKVLTPPETPPALPDFLRQYQRRGVEWMHHLGETGCHGLLADDRMRRHWLERIGAEASDLRYEPEVEATLDRLADHLEAHVDCDGLLAMAQTPAITPG